MDYTDDSILPENMAPLIITAAPFGPEWLPGDCDIPLSWDEQVQRAVDGRFADPLGALAEALLDLLDREMSGGGEDDQKPGPN